MSDVLTLSEPEAQAVAQLATAYATAVPEQRSAPYTALARAALGGQLVDDDLGTLERVVTLALETGKAHQLGLAETEQLIAAVWARTPQGRARAREVRAVNDVLARLAGRELTGVTVSSRRPGRYAIDLRVTGFALTLVVDRAGVEVQRLETS
ncbi:MAG: hypothetical protein LT071_14490 [Nocardioides sp.]|nr:hypothetical protein [Nocardioides sp.]